MRVATLLPSATEIVCALGYEDRLVGVSHSCALPEYAAAVPAMTSTHVPYQDDSQAIDSYVREHLGSHEALYDLHIDRLREVRPDVIISQALCDVCAVASGDVLAAVAELPGSPALIDLTPNTLGDVFDDIRRVGDALGCGDAAAEILRSLEERRDRIAAQTAAVAENDRPQVAFLEWLLPPFSGGHWNPELVELAGGINLLGEHGLPSTTLDWAEIIAAAPDLVFVACCGFDIPRALADVESLAGDRDWLVLRQHARRGVFVSNGNAWFASPGPRLIDGLEILAQVFHPDLFGEPSIDRCRRA